MDVPRLPNIEPFIGSFLKAATEEEMVKISRTTNVSETIDLMENMFKYSSLLLKFSESYLLMI